MIRWNDRLGKLTTYCILYPRVPLLASAVAYLVLRRESSDAALLGAVLVEEL